VWKKYFAKPWQKGVAYLLTWRELLLRPFAFTALSEEERRKYTNVKDFVAWTFIVAAALTYVGARILDDPLAPPGTTTVESPLFLYLNLAIFLALWWFFGVLTVRIFRRNTPSVPMKRIFNALVYLLVGPAAAVQIPIFLAALLLLPIFFWALAQGNFSLGLIVGLGFLAVGLTPFFFTAWLITRAVRQFCRVGTWRGIIIPAVCWVLALCAVFYLHRSTTAEHFSTNERDALRRLYILSDLESVSTCRDGRWEADFEKLKSLQPGGHECGVWNPILSAEGLAALSYTPEMVGYRFTIQIHNAGKGCIIWALPLNWAEGTRQSFATRCTLTAGIETQTFAQNALGGRPNALLGRTVIAGPEWDNLQ
jgi:hypothetical protein